jgi:uncharacterized membrane protein
MRDMGDGMTWWMAISVPPIATVVIILAMWAAAAFKSSAGSRTAGRTAIDVAKKRYARGEISREKLEQLTEGLHGPREAHSDR